MMEKILFCGYRDWALSIFADLELYVYNFQFDLAEDKDAMSRKLATHDYNVVLFIGWSWIIDSSIVDSKFCICLHPSPLPKYRGGSPVQHQIINGESTSAVTLFTMDNELDHGPILWQQEYALQGQLDSIFTDIHQLGTTGLIKILSQYYKDKKFVGVDQDHDNATFFTRRRPSQSEIKVDDFTKYTAEELYNKVRALQTPYPNAYITCKDGTKLFIQKVRC